MDTKILRKNTDVKKNLSDNNKEMEMMHKDIEMESVVTYIYPQDSSYTIHMVQATNYFPDHCVEPRA